MAKGLANTRHERDKARARAAEHFRALFENYKSWVTPKVLAKHATTRSVCGAPGCRSCSRSMHFSYTKAYHDAKVSYGDTDDF